MGFVCVLVELCFVEGVKDVRKVMPTNTTMNGLTTVLTDVFGFIWSTR